MGFILTRELHLGTVHTWYAVNLSSIVFLGILKFMISTQFPTARCKLCKGVDIYDLLPRSHYSGFQNGGLRPWRDHIYVGIPISRFTFLGPNFKFRIWITLRGTFAPISPQMNWVCTDGLTFCKSAKFCRCFYFGSLSQSMRLRQWKSCCNILKCITWVYFK